MGEGAVVEVEVKEELVWLERMEEVDRGDGGGCGWTCECTEY